MKASELVEHLNSFIESHGDLDVAVGDDKRELGLVGVAYSGLDKRYKLILMLLRLND